jgi:hypothetical protein
MQTPADPHGSPREAPAFPAEAVDWLVGGSQRQKVAALTPGYLTIAVTRAGHHVMALPGHATAVLDTVIASNHLPADLDVMAGSLRSGGRLSLVCSRRDQRVPWARKLDLLLGVTAPDDPADDPAAALVASPRFGAVEQETFRYWQIVNHDSLATLLHDELDHLDPADRAARISAALELYAGYGRGVDGMQMPWVSTCYRATVVPTASTSDAPSPAEDEQGLFGSAADATLLIDFR